jgi:hypothetical protein
MKRLFFLSLFACLAAPAFAQPKPLPPEVRAMLPQNIVSLGIYELSPAPGAPKYLVHLWAAPRRNPTGGLFRRPLHQGAVTEEEARSDDGLLLKSPFVMDIFSNPTNPKYEATITYSANRTPNKVLVSYFNSTKKEGLVFQVQTIFSTTTTDSFFVFVNGLEQDYVVDKKAKTVSSGGGGYYTVARGADGEFQVLAVDTRGSSETLRWNGREFARSVNGFIHR